ncbi:MAG: hypothetical protein QG622_3700 [Actinomycetota bacterium]|nr:hypothetical protein [Actinomycetota bacterium]
MPPSKTPVPDHATPADGPPARGSDDVRPGHPPRLGAVVLTVFAALAVYLVLAALLGPDGDPRYNFAFEQGTVTMLSTAMLMASTCLAAATVWATRGEGGRTRLLWVTLTLVMAYFTVDEVMEFHESFGVFMKERRVPTGPFRNWNDIIVIAYGVIAVPVALLVWREVLRFHRLFTMLVLAGLCYVGTTAVDTFSSDPTTVTTIVEETLKVSCSTLFALSMATGFAAARWLGSGSSAGRLTVGDGAIAVTGFLVPMCLAPAAIVLTTSDTGRDLISWAGAVIGAGIVLLAIERTAMRSDAAQEPVTTRS